MVLNSFDVSCAEAVDRIKIVFASSTDFYGRITIYEMDVLGKPLPA